MVPGVCAEVYRTEDSVVQQIAGFALVACHLQQCWPNPLLSLWWQTLCMFVSQFHSHMSHMGHVIRLLVSSIEFFNAHYNKWNVGLLKQHEHDEKVDSHSKRALWFQAYAQKSIEQKIALCKQIAGFALVACHLQQCWPNPLLSLWWQTLWMFVSQFHSHMSHMGT